MKKVLFFSLLVCAGLVSCDKSSTCECTVSATVMGYTHSQTVTEEYDGSCSKLEKEASGEIAQAVKELEAIGGSVSIDCREK